MTKTVDIEDVMENEFLSYYLPDELPSNWSDAAVDELADGSAERMREIVGADGVPAIHALFAAASADREHPVVRRIARSGEIDWTNDRWWPRMQQLLRAIAQRLDG